jgi:hypothetical protein
VGAASGGGKVRLGLDGAVDGWAGSAGRGEESSHHITIFYMPDWMWEMPIIVSTFNSVPHAPGDSNTQTATWQLRARAEPNVTENGRPSTTSISAARWSKLPSARISCQLARF